MSVRGIQGVCLCAAALLITACSAPKPEGALIADPYESLNRDVHNFNVGVDQVLLRPASQIYDFATPALVQHLVLNFSQHLRLPVVFVNNLLQLDLEKAGATLARFTTNTVLGAGGLLDPATEFGLPNTPTDAGATLASLEVDEGVFVMVPFFGPSTARDATGRVFDFAIDPFNFISLPGGPGVAAARAVVPVIDQRNRNAPFLDEVLYNSEDSYTTVRTAYVLARRRALEGETAEESLPDVFGDQ